MSKTPYAQQKEARQQNTSALLRDLWQHAPLTRAMLAERSGLTKATVSAICSDLLDLDLIHVAGQDRTGPGRPGRLLELNPQARGAIGVEISTNYAAVVLTDLCGEALWQLTAPYPVGSSEQAILGQAEMLIAKAIGQADERTALGPVLGIGVGVPGAVDPGKESLVTAPALGWVDVALRHRFARRFSLPVIVDNKARAAAMAEALHGSARGVDSFVYVSVGTDVRSTVDAAAVVDGVPFRGAHGLALDASHMILDPQGPLCSCGQRGCWQAMTDVGREVELIRPRLAAGEASTLQPLFAADPTALDHRAIHQAALEGDPLALDVAREINANHALGITNLVCLFDPQMVVIGLASAALPQPYLARMQALSQIPDLDVAAAVLGRLAQRGVAPPAIVQATYLHDACTLGAGALVVGGFLRNPPTDVVRVT